MKVGINLLWVRHGKNGGTESYIRNILDGLCEYAPQNIIFYLYVSKDNENSFDGYFNKKNFVKRVCNVNSSSQKNRIIWENCNLSKVGIKDALDVWFMPVYSRPILMSKRIPIITTIHDIQGIHYPEYFSKGRNLFFRLSWWWDCRTSNRIVTISNFCKKDIMKHFRVDEEKIEVIYNPIIANQSNDDFTFLEGKYDIKEKNYYYTVSSLAKHKNLITLLKAINILKKEGDAKKLVITGVSVNAKNEIEEFIKNNNLEDNIVFTSFISDKERDALYDHCSVFVFPSVFEGFGMPPIEALMRGVPVITTRETSLYEVTQAKAKYVMDPFDAAEWAELLKMRHVSSKYYFEKYEPKIIALQYLDLFRRVAEGK